MTTPMVSAARSSVLRLNPSRRFGSTYLDVVAGYSGSYLYRVPVPKGTWLVQLVSTFKNGARANLIGGIGGEILRVGPAVAGSPYPMATTQIAALTDTEVEILTYALDALENESAQVVITLFPLSAL